MSRGGIHESIKKCEIPFGNLKTASNKLTAELFDTVHEVMVTVPLLMYTPPPCELLYDCDAACDAAN